MLSAKEASQFLNQKNIFDHLQRFIFVIPSGKLKVKEGLKFYNFRNSPSLLNILLAQSLNVTAALKVNAEA